MEGKKYEVLASRPVWPQAHLTEIKETVESEEDDKPVDENVLIDKFAIMSFNQPNNITLTLYAFSSISTAIKDTPLALASLSQTFNSALDFAYTNHIIHDHSLFHCYDPDGGIPVKKANSGYLETLAVSDVKFYMTLNGHMIIWTLKNCLHALMVFINLVSTCSVGYCFAWHGQV
jgi:hypothetical protein